MGLEITPKVRFMKKGEKTNETKPIEEEEKSQSFQMIDENSNDGDDDWFTVKKVTDLPQVEIPEKVDKSAKLSKAKLAKKIRKKSLLINQRIEYDDAGNVR